MNRIPKNQEYQTIPSRKKTLIMMKAELSKAENNKEVIEKSQ